MHSSTLNLKTNNHIWLYMEIKKIFTINLKKRKKKKFTAPSLTESAHAPIISINKIIEKVTLRTIIKIAASIY